MTNERALELIKKDYEKDKENTDNSFEEDFIEAFFEQKEGGVYVNVE